jgi:hypothetical protein
MQGAFHFGRRCGTGEFVDRNTVPVFLAWKRHTRVAHLRQGLGHSGHYELVARALQSGCYRENCEPLIGWPACIKCQGFGIRRAFPQHAIGEFD